MNKKDLKKRINNDLNSIEIPDLKEKIKSNFNYLKVNDSPSYIYKERKYFKFVLKPALFCLLLCFMMVWAIIIIPDSSKIPTPTIINATTKAREAFGMQAVTLFNISNDVFENSTKKTRKLRNDNDDYSDEDYNKIVDTIDNYLKTALNLLNKEDTKFIIEDINGEYKYKMSISIPTIDNIQVFELYFNEEPLENKIELSKKQHHGSFDEISTKLIGIIKYNNNDYELYGTKEIKNQDIEIELKLFLSEDKSKYLEVSQEIEHHENEYSYEYYENNKLINQFEVSIETKNNRKTVELEVLNLGSAYEFAFLMHENHIKVEYEFNDYEGEVLILIDKENNKYIYRFDNIEIIKG